MENGEKTSWWATGLLFENCNCQLVCPGHIHFTQLCTHARCQGYWAIRFDGGAFGASPLAGVKAAVVYDTPQLMSSGDWNEAIFIDEAADAAQRIAVETILRGEAGGPWAVLARFVGRWTPTQYLPIEIRDEGPQKSLGIAGRLRASIAAIRGRDRSQPVRFENIYNQIHDASQALARGDTDFTGRELHLTIHNRGSHALYSNFTWRP